MNATPDASPALLARHPILDRDGRIRGHELLFRDGVVPETALPSLSALAGGVPAWVRAPREWLMTTELEPVASTSVVLQLPATVRADDELLTRLHGLRADGYAVALDDYSPRQDGEALLRIADHAKVSLAAYGITGLRPILESLPYERPRVCVTGVELPSQRDACVRRGIELLQGWFFERPRHNAAWVAPIASLDRLKALVSLRGNPGFEEVEQVVAEDPGLTLRLLRFANSAAVSARRTLGSVREAMVLLGSERVRQFLLLVLLSELGQGRPALVAAAVLRGRLCEAIARDLQLGDPDTAFTAGVLSVVDALLDQPLNDVLSTLPLSPELRWALLGRSGPIGAALDMAIRIERNRFDAEEQRFARLDDVVAWTDQALGGLSV